ncbi:MAG: ABC transporter permease subunit, partial [Acidobacteriota bacterium]
MRWHRHRLLAWTLAGVVLWLVGYPVLITFMEALGFPQKLSLGHFAEFARYGGEWRALWNSLWISALSVLLSAAVGIPLGFVFERTDVPGRRTLGSLIALPVALPPLVGVIAFLFLYGESGFASRGLQNLLGLSRPPWRLVGPGEILLVHAYSMYVYFYLFTRASLARLDSSLLEAASSLGAGRWRTLWRVVLPLLSPALTGAALLTFMTSLASFSAPYIFGGGFRVMTTQIVASKLNGETAMAQVETITLASMALLGLWIMRLIDSGDTAMVGGVRGLAPSRRVFASRSARVSATLLGWGLALLLLLPHFTLILISFVPPGTWTVESVPPILNGDNYASLWSQPERLRPVANSLWMSVVATLGAVALGLAVARQSIKAGGSLGRALETLIALPWALPGTVFAVALATTFAVDAPL